MMPVERFDVAIIGAGAAGMFCAGVASQRGRRVVLIDHSARIGEKIRISGGGRCNFTNLEGANVERYLSGQPGFARDALRAYGPRQFIDLVGRHHIGFHEKHRGQLFCDDSSERIIAMLRAECDAGAVRWRTPCAVASVGVVEARSGREFSLLTDGGELRADALVVATGGLSVPKTGATDLGVRIARQFGVAVVPQRPGLVPLTFDDAAWRPFAALAGVALEVGIAAPADPKAPRFVEDLLFTHRGLSGPAMLQVSTFWRQGDPIEIDLAARSGVIESSLEAARSGGGRQIVGVLAEHLPRRLAQVWIEHAGVAGIQAQTRVAEVGKRALAELAESLHRWRLMPSGSAGYRKAEVTAGGVDTAALDPRTMQARAAPGLYFVGEVVDVTGWLGGYNFQWAWSSGYAAAMAVSG